MLGWVRKKGKAHLKPLYELPQDSLYIPQQEGTRVPICLKAVSDSEKKLGVYTCSMGDFSYHVAHILTTGSEYTERLGTQTLPARDAWIGTRYQLFPKLIYGAAAVTDSLQKLEDAFESIWYKLLPSLCVNRNITKEYRMLPLRFQGLALPNLNIDVPSKNIHRHTGIQGACWDGCFIKHVRCFRSRLDLAGISFPILYLLWQTHHPWVLL
jgi:hypothetical protein